MIMCSLIVVVDLIYLDTSCVKNSAYAELPTKSIKKIYLFITETQNVSVSCQLW
jgi:hypothetical protein